MPKNYSSSPPPPWVVQILTLDYLVDGIFDPEDVENKNALVDYFCARLYDSTASLFPLYLTEVNYQSAGILATPDGSAGEWLAFPQGWVALIPRDGDSAAYVLRHLKFKDQCVADLYVGPYIIHGKLLCPDEDLNVLGSYATLAVQDAKIECKLPGAKLRGLEAPLAIVRTQYLQNIAILG